MPAWFLYIVRCSDNTLYTGIAKDVEKRVGEHNTSDTLGAKYTKSRRPVQLVYKESHPSRSAAAQREHQIKKMTKQQKENIIALSLSHQ